MFDYSICSEADEGIFKKQCLALENKIKGLIKNDILIDVDESKIQEYQLGAKRIVVYNDYNIGAVYIKSEVELTQYFK